MARWPGILYLLRSAFAGCPDLSGAGHPEKAEFLIMSGVVKLMESGGLQHRGEGHTDVTSNSLSNWSGFELVILLQSPSCDQLGARRE